MSQPMLISRTQLMAHAMCSDEASRASLQNLHVAADGTVTASDGHVMVRVTRINPPAVDDYPLPSADWVAPEVPKDGFMLPAKAAANMLKAQPKVKSYHPLLRNILLESLNGTVTLSATDLDSRPTVTERTPEGPYPNITEGPSASHVIPSQDRAGDVVIGVNPVLAAQFFATLAKMLKEDGSRADHVTLRIPANGKSAIRADVTSDNHNFVALLMPMLVPNAGIAKATLADAERVQ